MNEQLKTEYHKQNGLFQTLRDKYNEKILILMNENKRLGEIVKGMNEGNHQNTDETTESPEQSQQSVCDEVCDESNNSEASEIVEK